MSIFAALLRGAYRLPGASARGNAAHNNAQAEPLTQPRRIVALKP
mgnify:FL=1